jgi:hypothetical protein
LQRRTLVALSSNSSPFMLWHCSVTALSPIQWHPTGSKTN